MKSISLVKVIMNHDDEAKAIHMCWLAPSNLLGLLLAAVELHSAMSEGSS